MQPVEPFLDPIHFPRRMSWRRRVAAWLNQHSDSAEAAFLDSSADRIRRVLEDRSHGLKMAVNISADALLSFLQSDRYQNVYDKPIVVGERRKPSETRKEVDRLQGLGDEAHKYYCGAAELGGTGVRFYGEYCMILRPKRIAKSTRMFERNPYDLVESPLCDARDQESVAKALRGLWGRDRIDILELKILPKLIGIHRLVTTGIIGNCVLNDEDFIEIQKKGTFGPNDLYEIRFRPAESVQEKEIEARLEQRQLPSLVEMEWTRRRRLVAQKLSERDVSLRMVTTTGRDERWG